MTIEMKSIKLICNFTVFLCFLLSRYSLSGQDDLIHLFSKREVFIDHYLIEKSKGVQLVMHRPIDEGPILHFDNPWEGPFCGYCTVIKDGDLFRVYYRGIREARMARIWRQPVLRSQKTGSIGTSLT